MARNSARHQHRRLRLQVQSAIGLALARLVYLLPQLMVKLLHLTKLVGVASQNALNTLVLFVQARSKAINDSVKHLHDFLWIAQVIQNRFRVQSTQELE